MIWDFLYVSQVKKKSSFLLLTGYSCDQKDVHDQISLTYFNKFSPSIGVIKN